jgi:hypothetical protein
MRTWQQILADAYGDWRRLEDWLMWGGRNEVFDGRDSMKCILAKWVIEELVLTLGIKPERSGGFWVDEYGDLYYADELVAKGKQWQRELAIAAYWVCRRGAIDSADALDMLVMIAG